MSENALDRVLVLEMVRVTEAAAVAASKLIGRGDEKAADHAAVEAMRAALNQLEFDGTVVIGEGERDEAPMLFIGEKVGSAQGTGPKIDIALDPLEGTTITAKAGPNALAVLAVAAEGHLLNAPDVYMDKLAVGPGYPDGVIDLSKSVTDNIKAIAAAKGVQPNEIIACVLDRPRHAADLRLEAGGTDDRGQGLLAGRARQRRRPGPPGRLRRGHRQGRRGAGHHQDLHIVQRGIEPHILADLVARDLGQHDIQQHQIRPRLADQLDRARAGGDPLLAVSLARHQVIQRDGDVVLVLDDQDALRLRWLVHRSPPPGPRRRWSAPRHRPRPAPRSPPPACRRH